MAKGIFNPYVEKKKKKSKPVDPLLEELGKAETSVRLDGDSYVLELGKTELEQVPARLAGIVQDFEPDHLSRHRVSLTKDKPGGDKETVVLPTPEGYLSVYVGEGGTEVDAFRRLGRAFYGFQDVLDKHHTRVIVRA